MDFTIDQERDDGFPVLSIDKYIEVPWVEVNYKVRS